MITRLSVTLAAAICLLGCNKATEPAADKPADKPAPGGQADSGQKNEMKTTASGLKYQVLRHGTGSVSPKVTDTVNVHYHGTLLDGTGQRIVNGVGSTTGWQAVRRTRE